MMKTDLKERWVKALRSGRYKQARNALKYQVGEEKPSYCCLGVLATVSKLGKWEDNIYTIKLPEDNVYLDGERAITISDGEFSSRALELIDMTYSQQCDLISMNDTKQNNFKEIADWIEKHL